LAERCHELRLDPQQLRLAPAFPCCSVGQRFLQSFPGFPDFAPSQQAAGEDAQVPAVSLVQLLHCFSEVPRTIGTICSINTPEALGQVGPDWRHGGDVDHTLDETLCQRAVAGEQ